VELRQDDVEPDEGCYVDQERLQLVGCVLVGDAFGQGVGFLAVVYGSVCGSIRENLLLLFFCQLYKHRYTYPPSWSRSEERRSDIQA
jgi:hypothetical protein